MWLRRAHCLELFFVALTTSTIPAICWCKEVVEEDHREIIFHEVIEGEVELENFTYYIVDSKEDILLNLTSLIGDCDLYISQARRLGENPPNPTIETHSYDLQSTTCGEDVIAINQDVVRPICIGIYAHPSNQLCSFRLEITGTKSEYLEPNNAYDDYEPQDDVPSQDVFKQHHQQQQHKRTSSREHSEFDSFLELLLNITIQCLGFIFEVIL